MALISPGTIGSGTVLGSQKLIKSRVTDTPGAPSAGDQYIVPVGATGLFATHDNEIATFSTTWSFQTASEGWQAYIDDEDETYQFDGSVWNIMSYVTGGAPGVHAASHEDGGADEVTVEDLPTASGITSNILQGSATPGAIRIAQLRWTAPVISLLDAPPVSPSIGDRYRCNAAPTGGWTGWAHRIVEYSTAGAWVSFVGVAGDVHYNIDQDEFGYWTGTVWKSLIFYQHTIGGAWHAASTLAELNAMVSDATLDDSSAARTPTAHAASHADGGSDEINDSDVTTTDETVTTLATIPIPDDSAVLIEVEIVAFRTDDADQAIYKIAALVFRRATGIATLEGAAQAIHTVESDANWDATIDIDGGNNALIRVTGAAGKTIKWRSHHTLRTVS